MAEEHPLSFLPHVDNMPVQPPPTKEHFVGKPLLVTPGSIGTLSGFTRPPPRLPALKLPSNTATVSLYAQTPMASPLRPHSPMHTPVISARTPHTRPWSP